MEIQIIRRLPKGDTFEQTIEVPTREESRPDRSVDLPCSAVIRLIGLTHEEIRRDGNLAQQQDESVHATHDIEKFQDPPHVRLNHPLRGDHQVDRSDATIFIHDTDKPDTNACIAIHGISGRSLRSDSTSKATSTTRRPLTIVQALTVDGNGGQFENNEGGIRACIWYYLENIFGKIPSDDSFLQKITIDEPISKLVVGVPFAVQTFNFQEWFNSYRERAITSPLHRPITEQYYRQLMAMDLNEQEKKELGILLFGEVTWRMLKSRKKAILANTTY